MTKGQGLVIFFTGLSGSGKTTLANLLGSKLMNIYGRDVKILDGDDVRKLLCSELGFSKKHRNLNIKRIGYVASIIAGFNGVAICSAIAPYDAARKDVRKMVENNYGKFILVYLSTPLDVCEERDPKGLYKKARDGKLKKFTGISDPYEIPSDADVVINTNKHTEDNYIDQILEELKKRRLLD